VSDKDLLSDDYPAGNFLSFATKNIKHQQLNVSKDELLSQCSSRVANSSGEQTVLNN
jgi:hypothetical protein